MTPSGSIISMRKQTGLSQAKFAAIFDIPVATLQDWEHGRRTPPSYVPEMMQTILKNIYHYPGADLSSLHTKKEPSGSDSMLAVKGTIKNNQIITGDNISAYNGRTVIITILDSVLPKKKKINPDQYSTHTERCQHVDEYMDEMSNNE